MHHQENAAKVQNSGQNGAHNDIGIRHAHDLGHQKGRRTHDGGHDLAAGRAGSFHRTGKLAGIAGFLHHGNGHRAGGNGVAHRRAGNHAAQCRGDNGHLCRAAGRAARQSVGAGNKEVGNAGGFQKSAENNKQNNVGAAHAHGSADHAGGGVEQVIDHDAQALARTQKGIGHKASCHHQNGNAGNPAAALGQNQNADDAQNLLKLADTGGVVDDGAVVEHIIKETAAAHQGQNDIIDGNMVHLLLHALFDGEQKEHKQNHNAQKQRAANALVPHGKQVHADHEQRECRQQQLDRFCGLSLPRARVGFAVILFHNGVHIGLRAHIGSLAFGDGIGFFLVQR